MLIEAPARDIPYQSVSEHPAAKCKFGELQWAKTGAFRGSVSVARDNRFFAALKAGEAETDASASGCSCLR